MRQSPPAPEGPAQKLAEAGRMKDADLDLALVALYLAELNHPGISLDRYIQHLRKTGDDVAARHKALLDAGADDDAATRLAALKHVIADGQDIRGAAEDYDALENADLIRVIDRRRGLPVALAILYLDAGRRQGWKIEGLNFPGHFIMRIEKDGERILFDPFNGCRVLQAADLRGLVKLHMGANAELSAGYYEPCANRQILMRLQNNVKSRLIEAEDYQGALGIVEAMRLVDPDEHRLLLDAGVLYARTGQPEKAAGALERYIAIAPHDREALALLRHIQATME